MKALNFCSVRFCTIFFAMDVNVEFVRLKMAVSFDSRRNQGCASWGWDGTRWSCCMRFSNLLIIVYSVAFVTIVGERARKPPSPSLPPQKVSGHTFVRAHPSPCIGLYYWFAFSSN